MSEITLEEMIASKAGDSINKIVSVVMENIRREKIYIDVCDEIAYPAAMIAEMIDMHPVTIHNWFEIGKLKNVSSEGKVKKAKFKQFKHLVKRRDL